MPSLCVVQGISHGTASPSQAGLELLHIYYEGNARSTLCTHHLAVVQQQLQEQQLPVGIPLMACLMLLPAAH